MKRGDVVIAVLPREQGKPRPSIVIQSDALSGSSSVIVCPLTSDANYAAPHRPLVQPTSTNGLRITSLAMTDKLQVTPRDRCGQVIGSLEDEQMKALDTAVAFVLGLQP